MAESALDITDEPIDGSAPTTTNRRGVAAVLVANSGFAFATLMPPLVALPIYVERFDAEHKAGVLGVALGFLALCLLIFTPIFGAISDRTTSRLGMRKPGLIGGSVVIAAGLVLQGTANGVGPLLVGVVVMAIGAAGFTASFSALIPDQVAPSARGRVLGLQSLVLVVAGVTATFVGPALLENQFVLFAGGGALMVVTTAIAVVLLQDRKQGRDAVVPQPMMRSLVSGFRFDPRSAPDFSWVWASRFLVTLGISFAGFSVYFLTDQLAVTDSDLPGLITTVGLINLGGTIIGTLSGAYLSDRLGRRKSLVVVSGMILAAGGLLTSFSPNVPFFLFAAAIIAFGLGTFIPIDGALVMDVLPGGSAQTGKYMSLMTIADQLPRAIGPFIAPAIISIGATTPFGGYPALYLFMGVFAILGGLVVRRVKASS